MFAKIFQKQGTPLLNNEMVQPLLPKVQEAGGAKAEVEAGGAKAGGAKAGGAKAEVEAEVEQKQYDIIYIDGSHVACDVLLDAVCSFTLLSVRKIFLFFFVIFN